MRLPILATIAAISFATSASAATVQVNGHAIDLDKVVFEPNNVDLNGCPSFTGGQAFRQNRIACNDGSTIGYEVSTHDSKIYAKLTRTSRDRNLGRRFDQKPASDPSSFGDRRFGEDSSSRRRYYPGEFPTQPSRQFQYRPPVVVAVPMYQPLCGMVIGNVYVRTSCYYGGMRYRPMRTSVRFGGHYGRRRWH